MDVQKVMSMLPTEASEGFLWEAIEENTKELGGDLLIFSRESEELTPEWKQVMDPEDKAAFIKGCKRVWAARCICTKCGSEWMSGWVGGGEILLYEGEDGCTYPGVCQLGEEGTKFVGEGDGCLCPYCEAPVRGIARKRLKNGRTHQVMVLTVGNVGEYTALFYWLVSRRIGKEGVENEGAQPVAAAVLDEDGCIRMFTRSHSGGYGKIYPGDKWKESQRGNDPDIWPYHSAEANNAKKKGAVLLRGAVPDQTGKTGEKTGLESYIRQGGSYPLGYLRFWNEHRNIENLVKAGGWVKAINDALQGECGTWMDVGHGNVKGIGLEDLAEWAYAKPNEMLGMTKEEFRKACGWGWRVGEMELWRESLCVEMAREGDAEAFNYYLTQYGSGAVAQYIGTETEGEDVPPIWEIAKYLKKQERRHGLNQRVALGMYLDYWNMMDDYIGGRRMTPAEMWPGNLRDAHDDLAEAIQVKRETAMGKAAFEKVYQKWKALEWSDGEICIRLPRSNADLRSEGKALDHCVGTYGENHINGSLILFVRHARRPERSWYTLNISVMGKNWREIQLHGYGNKWVSAKNIKLKIPERVRGFCDRWEDEILTPVFRAVKAEEDKKSKSKKSKKKEANVA